jgi:hypothetical protein
MGFFLRACATQFELVKELLPTLDKDDGTYRVLMQGLEKMKLGIASIVFENLEMLTERENYGRDELLRLVDYMAETYPRLVPMLPPSSRTEFVTKLQSMRISPALKDLQPGLDELYSKVMASLEKTGAP